ncbi:hypothetical protein [Pseudovibrio sp. Tun.PSC04-5.I4]|uniref:hypothetical protein n=1 Tax=Pseudovibrio sp. Tun.PSC04-5.I4 TaxID=1798213 RepID=UPI001FCC919D|nr:hypothetical protein [Pseudovibrio sp. Tun.PSC04-5.I4]
MESGIIVCSELTEDIVGDPTVVPDILDQVEGPVGTFLGDGAYDGTPTHHEIADRFDGVEVIIPPPKTAAHRLRSLLRPVTGIFFSLRNMAEQGGRSRPDTGGVQEARP